MNIITKTIAVVSVCMTSTVAQAETSAGGLIGALVLGGIANEATNHNPVGTLLGAIVGYNLGEQNEKNVRRQQQQQQQQHTHAPKRNKHNRKSALRMSDDEYIDYFGERAVHTGHTQRWSNERTGSNGVIRIVDEYTYNNQFCRVWQTDTFRAYDNRYTGGEGTACKNKFQHNATWRRQH